MTDAETLYNTIVSDLIEAHEGVVIGKMMTSPGVKYNNKVFAFFYKDEMTFRLGKDFDPETVGLKRIKFLSPFKNKPPMKGWWMVSYEERHLWKELAEIALEKLVLPNSVSARPALSIPEGSK